MAFSYTEEYLSELYARVQKKYRFPEKLKAKQVEALLSILSGSDSLCVFPTGYGKTFVYTLLPLLWDEHVTDTSQQHAVIVVSPLKSLMADQASQLVERGVSVGVLSAQSTGEQKEAIRIGAKSVIFGSPEMLTKWSETLSDDGYPRTVVALVIDECHNIVDWQTFRPHYTQLQALKSVVASRKPWALFTATCDDELRDALMKAVHAEDLVTLTLSPDRPNIYLHVLADSAMRMEKYFNPLLKTLKEKKQNAPKTIVYCRSKDACGELFEYLNVGLMDDAYVKDADGAWCRVLEQFSSSYAGEDAVRIIKRVTTNDRTLRCIISTVALGMGVNMRDINEVMHWVAPTTVLQYWQEVGRAGRDGSPATATLFATARSLVRASDGMKDVVHASRKDMCVRKAVLGRLQLKDSHTTRSNTGSCPGNCSTDCSCELCMCCSSCRRSCTCRGVPVVSQ